MGRGWDRVGWANYGRHTVAGDDWRELQYKDTTGVPPPLPRQL